MTWSASKERRAEVWEKTNGHCWYCGAELSLICSANDSANLCIDHVIPQAQGGSHGIENLVPACRQCNSQKGARTLDQYRWWIAWMLCGVTPFTDDQLEWLRDEGIEITIPYRWEFWFEKELEKGA